MKKQILFCLAATFLMMACNNSSEESSTAVINDSSEESTFHTSADDTKIDSVNATYTDLNLQASIFVKNILGDYLRVKSSLVRGDSKSAAKGAVTLNDHLKSFDKSYFTAAQKKEFDSIEESLRKTSAEIATQDIKDQRKTFKTLSGNMYTLAKNFETGQTLYKEYCPMYEGGAAWISAENEIENPYYGDKMLDCGTVKEVIQ